MLRSSLSRSTTALLAGEDGEALTADNLARGIDEAVRAGAKIIDVSPASFAGSGALRASVERAIRKEVLVVAAIGERPQEEGQPGFRDYGAYEPDENVLTYPAAYPGVLGVGIGTAEGSFDSDVHFASDTIDVVAPVFEGVSTTQNGSTCVIDVVTTSLAAGVVSGLAALLMDKYPDYNPAQIAAVIMETANGTMAVPQSSRRRRRDPGQRGDDPAAEDRTRRHCRPGPPAARPDPTRASCRTRRRPVSRDAQITDLVGRGGRRRPVACAVGPAVAAPLTNAYWSTVTSIVLSRSGSESTSMATIRSATTVKAITNWARPCGATTTPAAPLINAGRTKGESRWR